MKSKFLYIKSFTKLDLLYFTHHTSWLLYNLTFVSTTKYFKTHKQWAKCNFPNSFTFDILADISYKLSTKNVKIYLNLWENILLLKCRHIFTFFSKVVFSPLFKKKKIEKIQRQFYERLSEEKWINVYIVFKFPIFLLHNSKFSINFLKIFIK